jgi:hypothetical protein
MGSGNKSGKFDWVYLVIAGAAFVGLPIVFGDLYFSHTSLMPDQLIEKTGRLESWKVESLYRSSKSWSPPAHDLYIYTAGDSRPYVVRSRYYDRPEYFNFAGFQKDVKKGDQLSFMVLKGEADFNGYRNLDVYGLASGNSCYLTVADKVAYDASNNRISLYLFLGFSAVLASSYPAARMFWSGPKQAKKAARAAKKKA